MIYNIQIPDESIKYILFQRTSYLRLTENKLFRILNNITPFPIYNRFVELESNFAKDRVKRLYTEDMIKEYETIKKALPDSCGSILDIGCGVAGIDILLFNHYAGSKIKFYLLDKTHLDNNVTYMFKPEGKFYNSLPIAKRLLCLNGIPENDITTIEASQQYGIDLSLKVDLVISLLSWGHHYPVDIYIDQVHSLMNDGGRLILDIRKGTAGKETLESKFKNSKQIMNSEKSERLLCVKRG